MLTSCPKGWCGRGEEGWRWGADVTVEAPVTMPPNELPMAKADAFGHMVRAPGYYLRVWDSNLITYKTTKLYSTTQSKQFRCQSFQCKLSRWRLESTWLTSISSISVELPSPSVGRNVIGQRLTARPMTFLSYMKSNQG